MLAAIPIIIITIFFFFDKLPLDKKVSLLVAALLSLSVLLPLFCNEVLLFTDNRKLISQELY